MHMNPRPPAAPRSRKLLLASLALALAGCGQAPGGADKPGPGARVAQAAEARGGSERQAEAPPVPVEVAPVQRRPIEASYSGTAALQATEEAEVVAKTSGVLLEILTEEGQRVRAGQVLARIDPDRARLEVARAEAMLRKLEAEYARSQELFRRKLVAADAHERLRFDVETQRAAWNLARLELDHTEVKAPISGVVAQRLVKVGNLIQLNQPMFRIVHTDRLEAVLNVPEREVGKLQPGAEVSLTVDALPGRRFAGVLDRISPVVDPATGTFRATAFFDSGEGALKPGMFGRIQVVYERRADVLTVPRQALLEDEAEPAVYVVVDGKAVRTPVRLGYMNGAFAEVVDGLEEGDTVVTAGKVAIRDGSRVQVIEGTPPEGAGLADGVADARP